MKSHQYQLIWCCIWNLLIFDAEEFSLMSNTFQICSNDEARLDLYFSVNKLKRTLDIIRQALKQKPYRLHWLLCEVKTLLMIIRKVEKPQCCSHKKSYEFSSA